MLGIMFNWTSLNNTETRECVCVCVRVVAEWTVYTAHVFSHWTGITSMSPYVCHLTHKLHAYKRSACVCVSFFARNVRLCFFQKQNSFADLLLIYLLCHFMFVFSFLESSWVFLLVGCEHEFSCNWSEFIYQHVRRPVSVNKTDLHVESAALLAVRCLVWWEKKK